MLPVVVARSSSGGIAMSYVLPVLRRRHIFYEVLVNDDKYVDHYVAMPTKDVYSKNSSAAALGGEVWCLRLGCFDVLLTSPAC